MNHSHSPTKKKRAEASRVSACRSRLNWRANWTRWRLKKRYSNRSLAIADMVRAALMEHRSEWAEEIAGTITPLFDHHKPRLSGLLTDLQHDHTDLIISTLHVHLDHDNCLEVIAVRGEALRVRALANGLIAAKGVKHGRLTVTATGQDLPPHSHE